MIYYKRYTGKLLPQKTAEQPSWVQWTHHSEGKTHCEECLMLDGCWFQEENAPSCPHHPYCHCTLDPIPYAVVLMNTTSYSDYSKFDLLWSSIFVTLVAKKYHESVTLPSGLRMVYDNH